MHAKQFKINRHTLGLNRDRLDIVVAERSERKLDIE